MVFNIRSFCYKIVECEEVAYENKVNKSTNVCPSVITSSIMIQIYKVIT